MRRPVTPLRVFMFLLASLLASSSAGSVVSTARADACLPAGLELARLLKGLWIGQGSIDGQRWIANMRFNYADDPCSYPTLTIPNWGTAQIQKFDGEEVGEEVYYSSFVRPEGKFGLQFRFYADGTNYWIHTRGAFWAAGVTGNASLFLEERVVHELSLGAVRQR